MVGIGKITKGFTGLPNKIIKFAIDGLMGSLVVVLAVSFLGEFLGGLIGGAFLAGIGNPTLGAIVAFDGILSLFVPAPSGGI